MRWFPGDTATLHMEFTVGGTPTDPTTIELHVIDPEGDLTTYTSPATITKIGTGIYEKDIALADEGQYRWRWVGTGTVPAADEGSINVRFSEFVSTA